MRRLKVRNLSVAILLVFLMAAPLEAGRGLAVPPGAQAVTVPPGIYTLTEPIVLGDLPRGFVYDASAAVFIAAQPMWAMMRVEPSAGQQQLDVTIRLGILDGRGLAAVGLAVTRTQDSLFEVRSIQNMVDAGVYAYQTGEFGTFNNFWRIGSIRNGTYNGFVAYSPDKGVLGFQGNHVEIGQIIAQGQSGIAIFGQQSCCNFFLVGPVEHNGQYGCYDEGQQNQWIIVNSNSNGLTQRC